MSTARTAPFAASRHGLGQGRYAITDVLQSSGARTLLVSQSPDMPQPMLMERVTGLSKVELRRALDRAGALLALAHPNLARAIDCFVEDGALHVVMVTGPGALLSDPHGLMSQRAAIDIGTQLCNALGYLAWRGIPQLPTIDPTTVYLTTPGRVKITHLSALLGIRAMRRSAMAAAQPHSPLFGIGATVHHALTGWPTRSLLAAPNLTTLRPDLSPECSHALARALAPSDGWATPADLRYALLQIPA